MRRLTMIVLASTLVPVSATAGKRSPGALGRVTSSVRSKTSAPSSGRSGGHSSSSQPSRHRPRDSDIDVEVGVSTTAASSAACFSCPATTIESTGPRRAGSRATTLHLDVAVQAVQDSDRAVMVDVRAVHRSFGLGASSNSYFERNRLGLEPRTIQMDLWTLYASVRLISVPNAHLDVIGGLAGARSNQFRSLLGATAGAEAVIGTPRSLSVVVGGRYFTLDDGAVQATEGRLGLRASHAYLGYRAVHFSDAPPLRGPEAGLAVRF